MGSSIAKGWMLKKLNFNFFVIEKVSSLRKVAGDDGFKAFENINKLNELVEIKSGDIFFLAVKPQQMKETIDSFLNLILTIFFSFLLQQVYHFLGFNPKLVEI